MLSLSLEPGPSESNIIFWLDPPSDVRTHLTVWVCALVSVCLCLQVKDCLDHSALPMDGATLTEALHQRGINVRYLGNVLEFVDKTPARAQLDHLYVSDGAPL